jgi:S-DNA-T family DNA segregation ATPase FtsK/SpoIIIE
MAAGWLLATDYLLVRLSGWLISIPARGFGRAIGGLGENTAQRRGKVRTDLNPAIGDDAGDDPPPVRIARKAAAPVDESNDDAPEASVDVKEPASEPSGGVQVAERKSGTLRVRPPKRRDEREQVMNALNAASRAEETPDYQLPPIDMLLESEPFAFEEQEKEVRRKAKILEQAFANFGLNVRVVEIETGPVIAQFEVELEAGLRLSKITSLADDLAIALRVPSVRIVAPIPGKNTVGIEVPNAERQLVRLREVIEESQAKAGKMRIPIFLGKDVSGNPIVVDLTSLPHLLIAGRTGTGKSVCLNTMIVSMLMARRPDEVRMLLIDPKMVELSPYKTLPHLMHPVVTDMRKAEAILAWAVEKMEERYALLARAGVRHISSYNQLGEEELFERLQPESDEERENIPTHLPYIVIVADEMADLMMTAAKEVETHIIRLAQKSRAVGIHLVLATQKPTVDVITGLIKSNLPARICFQVASRTDSRVVLDEMGADKLLGNGDLLFLWPGTSTLLRGQGTYVSDEEINKVVEFVGTTEPDFVKELVQLKATGPGEGDANRFKNRDDLYEAAIDIVVREGRGSVSLLQRSLGIGYGRGARLIDFMAEDGIVGPYNGSQAREVLITLDQWQEMSGQNGTAEPTKTVRSNRITPLADEEDVDEVEFDSGNEEGDEYEDGEVIDVESDEVEEESDEADEFEDEEVEEEDS